jgi:hypothetical protein
VFAGDFALEPPTPPMPVLAADMAPEPPQVPAPAAVPMPMRLAALALPACGLRRRLCADAGSAIIPSKRKTASTTETSLNLFIENIVLIPPPFPVG